mmetsp:Transcript_120161/g.345419  ORF Transcript_120161/g.345419 Transcript_120161/m.345419 type:complete len:114 (+) Transcript_120161:80-421(+)
MASWKHTFKAHRIAANAGNLGEHFIYHKEAQSFPTALERPATVRPSAMKARWMKLKRKIVPSGSVGSAFGFSLPVIGCGILGMFVWQSFSESNRAMQFAVERTSDPPRKGTAV